MKKFSDKKISILIIFGIIILSVISIIQLNQRLENINKLTFFDEEKNPIITINIEVADTHEERRIGLMNRQSFPEKTGMLFIFEEQKPRSFWMKNTYIPLDIIFVNEKFEIMTIQKNTEPLSEKSIFSDDPIMYTVEVNAGFTDKYEIKEGGYINYSLKQ
ncbi:DUF192 domain-containing protein [Candidatus Peregrinibacteria bacterium]|nr:DUF192 domain-containing protein [Candidatus Peregrinibacteria bacterium]